MAKKTAVEKNNFRAFQIIIETPEMLLFSKQKRLEIVEFF